ncbi:NAD(P)/FAD-dependent oxidoreductase [bacterium]|nr:NAD(P)/FAD-dependent oxidoreductase [bacterium]
MLGKIPRVVIVGCGFGGLATARGLAGEPVEVLLIDRNNYHVFKPLLPMVASAELSPFSIAAPTRTIFRNQKNLRVIQASAESVDLSRKVVITGQGEIEFDFLVLATGAEPNYFGNDRFAEICIPLASLSDARLIRNRILSAFEQAESACSIGGACSSELLNFVIVGAGPTGVELAGSFSTLVSRVLSKDFRGVDVKQAKIYLIELADRILPMPGLPASFSHYAEGILRERGIEVLTGSRVTDIDHRGVTIERKIEAEAGAESQSLFIPTGTVIWSAGMKAASLTESLGVALDRSGRVIVNSYLNPVEFENVFVIGDASRFEQNGGTLPCIAPVAKQMGSYVASSIKNSLAGVSMPPFVYEDTGTVVTIADGHGIASFKSLKLNGPAGWLVWLVAHVYFLIGFRNRSLVMVQWLFSWLFASRGARIITGATDSIHSVNEVK